MKEKREDLGVYKNEFNTIPLRNFTAVEMDLLFTLMSQMRERGTTDLKFGFEELKQLSKYNKENAIDSFVNDLEKTYDKLIQLNVKCGTSRKWTKFVFFTRYSVDKDEQTIDISVNPEFEHLINKLTGNFTKFELEEVTQLKSSYSKGMYRLLKQFRATGYAVFDIDNFRNLLDIPDSYKMGNIDQQILKPIEKELSKFFKHLKITKIKGIGKYKKNVVKIEFTFKKQDGIKDNGYRKFRDENGNYYEKHLYDFEDNEINKTFPCKIIKKR